MNRTRRIPVTEDEWERITLGIQSGELVEDSKEAERIVERTKELIPLRGRTSRPKAFLPALFSLLAVVALIIFAGYQTFGKSVTTRSEPSKSPKEAVNSSQNPSSSTAKNPAPSGKNVPMPDGKSSPAPSPSPRKSVPLGPGIQSPAPPVIESPAPVPSAPQSAGTIGGGTSTNPEGSSTITDSTPGESSQRTSKISDYEHGSEAPRDDSQSNDGLGNLSPAEDPAGVID